MNSFEVKIELSVGTILNISCRKEIISIRRITKGLNSFENIYVVTVLVLFTFCHLYDSICTSILILSSAKEG